MNHYDTLGVTRKSSADEIKAAYRKLAMEFHPDRNPNNAAAEDKFKKINAAYSELSDPVKRAAYDAALNQPKGFSQNSNYWQKSNSWDNNNFFDNFDLFVDMFYRAEQERRKQNQYASQANANIKKTIKIGFMSIFANQKATVEVFKNGASTKSEIVEISIPVGVTNGQILLYKGHGSNTNSKLPPGDLIIEVVIEPHPVFKREQQNLISNIDVDLITAIVGGPVKFKNIHNQDMLVNIPPGATHGKKLKVIGHGIPSQSAEKIIMGDLLLTVNLVVPPNLSEEHRTILKTIKESLEEKANGTTK